MESDPSRSKPRPAWDVDPPGYERASQDSGRKADAFSWRLLALLLFGLPIGVFALDAAGIRADNLIVPLIQFFEREPTPATATDSVPLLTSDHVRVAPSQEAVERKDENLVVVQDGWNWTAGDTVDTIKGSVHNGSDTTVGFFQVTAEFLDAKGNILDSAFTVDAFELKPKASRQFTIIRSSPSGATQARVFVSDVRWAER